MTGDPGCAYIFEVKREDYTEANRKAWNEVEPIHRRQRFESQLQNFTRVGRFCLDEIATVALKKIGLAGKSVELLCCNNGAELISIKNPGANTCSGFDISESFVSQARELAKSAGVDCEFIETDVYQIPGRFYRVFGVAFTSIGVFGWMPDLGNFVNVGRRILKPGGFYLISEQHPIADMPDEAQNSPRPQLKHFYFRAEPFVDSEGLDYFGHETYEAETTHWFHHRLSDIITH